MIVCSNEVQTFGKQCFEESDIGVTARIWLTPPSFAFATASAATTEATVLQAIADKNIIPLPNILEVELKAIADNVYATPGGYEIKLKDGARGSAYRMNIDKYRHGILKTYEKKNWSFFKVESLNGSVLGYTPDGTKVKGMDIQEFRVGSWQDVDNGKPAWTEIVIIEKDNRQFDTAPVILSDLSFDALDLDGINTVTLTQVGSVAANAFTVLVTLEDPTRKNGASSGADYTYLVEGLTTETASFQLVTTSTGAITNPTTVVVDSVITNKYVVTFAAADATDTVKVIPQADRDLLHESAYLTLA